MSDAVPPVRPPHDLSGQRVEGRYEVLRLLGEGGMGRVFLARDSLLPRHVVLKVPNELVLADAGFRERFRREIISLIGLEHPHVVKVLDVGDVGSTPFAMLQYLAGGTLEDRRQRLGRSFTGGEVLDWLPPIAGALDFIHRKGYLHRDVKPANIMFDEEGHVFLGDFGIVRALDDRDSNLTATGLIGSPRYMGPEAAFGREYGPAYDQYALAVVVYWALSGTTPHDAATPVALLTKKALEPPRPLRQVAPGQPAALGGVLERALQVGPDDRWPSCAAFATAFREALASPTAVGSSRSLPPGDVGDGDDTAAMEQTRTLGNIHRPSRPVPTEPRLREEPASLMRERPRRPRWRLPALVMVLVVSAAVLAFGAWREGWIELPDSLASWARPGTSPIADEPPRPGLRVEEAVRIVRPPTSDEASLPASEPGSPGAAAAAEETSPLESVVEGAGPVGSGATEPPARAGAAPSSLRPQTIAPIAAAERLEPPSSIEQTAKPRPAENPSRGREPGAKPSRPPGGGEEFAVREESKSAAAAAAVVAAVVAAADPETVPETVPEAAARVPMPEAEAVAPAPEPLAPLRELPRNAAGRRVFERLIDGARVVLIPGASFVMGGDDAEEDARPGRAVELSSYLIDEREVTWRQLTDWMKATGGVRPHRMPSWERDPTHPVVNATWDLSLDYCEWSGGRLPTEAEWEQAARGRDGRAWPWGPSFVEGAANWKAGAGPWAQTAPVASFPLDVSAHGVLDMGGNVTEWVADWYAADEYSRVSGRDPRGPSTGTERVYRGGNWNHTAAERLRATRRGSLDPQVHYATFGFRCAMDPPPDLR